MAWSNIGGGGENVKAEVEVQTPLVDQIMTALIGKVGDDANATAETILEGYKAWVQGEKVVGTYKPHGLYVWKKYEYESSTVGDFVDYVVSDTETEYPDGDVKDGYYYEKMDFSIEQIIGITKAAKDTFTFASDTYLNDATLTHSLGAIPKLVIVKDEKSQVVASGTYIAEIFGYANNALYKNGGGTYETQSFSNYYDATASNIRFNIATSTSRYCAGVEYTMYTFA